MTQQMSHQPTLNIGMVGHVANGKTSLTDCLTGIKTNKHSAEKKQNKTIRLGYANFKIWRCAMCNTYETSSSAVFNLKCDCEPNAEKTLVKHISIVDCPGHNTLMSTMLNGSSVMDYTILVESATNTECPAPQTAEHFRATKIAGIPNAMILMNKIDIVKRADIETRMDLLESYVRRETIGDTDTAENISPMVPVSASFGTNLDVVAEYLSKLREPADRDPNDTFEMLAIRSFDINKPGITHSVSELTPSTGDATAVTNYMPRNPDTIDKNDDEVCDVRYIKGGVIGGSIMRGTLCVGDSLIVLPGICKRLTADAKALHKTEADFSYTPIRCTAKSIRSESNNLDKAIAGGLLAVQVSIDPSFTRNDGLTGAIIIKEADYDSNRTEYRVYDKIVIKMESIIAPNIDAVLSNKSIIRTNINSNTIKAMVLKYSKRSGELRLFLVKPVPITSLNKHITVMMDSVNTSGSAEDCTVLGAGLIIDGIEALYQSM